jgi:hypothetical protein
MAPVVAALGGAMHAPSKPHAPNGGRVPASMARIDGRPMCVAFRMMEIEVPHMAGID